MALPTTMAAVLTMVPIMAVFAPSVFRVAWRNCAHVAACANAAALEYLAMEEIMHIAGHVLEHSIEDTLYLIPFLFVTYLAMEWLEHKAGDKAQNAIKRAGKAGPVIGAVLGVVPQCGFSAAASTLYAGRVITVGTLIAVLLSTSDEMIPIFLAAQVSLSTMGAILGAKVVVGIVAGLALDGVLRLLHRPEEHLRIHELCQRDHCHCNGECHACEENPELAYEAEKDEEHHHDHAGASIVKSALKHTAQVTVFIFIVTLLLNVVLETVGEDALAQILGSNSALSVVVAAIVGLIPNCAASVVIADLYVEGVLGAGAMFAGLLVSAGVGLLVLFRANRRPKQSLIIVAILLVVGIVAGAIVSAAGIVF